MMSNRSRDDLDRLMRSWMETDGRVREPEDLIDRVLEQTVTARRRPRWLLPEWWFPMQNVARWQAVWRPAPVLLLNALLLVAVALVAVLFGGSQHRVPAPFGPAANGSLVYDTNGTILIADQAGSNVRTLVGSVANAAAPLFSPDGLHLAFWGNDSPDTLYLANADGLNPRRLVENLWISTDKSPTWSPDSTRLMFSTESGPDRRDEHLVVVDIASGRAVTIELSARGGARPRARLLLPAWSPDGNWISFVALDGQTSRLWVARPDGTDARELATAELTATGVGPRWAPSGSKHVIAYNAITPNGRAVTAMFDVDTDRETQLPGDGSGPSFWPGWSPDGTRLASLGGSLVITPIEGSAPTTLPAAGLGGPVAWSPDGTRLYGLTRSGTVLVVVTIDGSIAPIRLPHQRSQGLPDWQRVAP
jgi:Tol biopolymer transport system component